MKTLLAILFCLPLLALADTTNTLTVVFTTEEAVKLTNAWRVNNFIRTNSGLPALNLRQFAETNAAPGILERVSNVMDGQLEAQLMANFRAASDEKRIAIIKESLKP